MAKEYGDSVPLHRLGFHPDTHALRRVRGFPPIELKTDGTWEVCFNGAMGTVQTFEQSDAAMQIDYKSIDFDSLT
jgi:hypothetical protein